MRPVPPSTTIEITVLLRDARASGSGAMSDDLRAVRRSMGGTSAAAPLWAGLIACVNEALRRPVGYLTPLLYTGDAARRNALRDITEGNNKLSGKQGYRARRGWDPCTGLGTPHGLNLLRWLKAVRRPV